MCSFSWALFASFPASPVTTAVAHWFFIGPAISVAGPVHYLPVTEFESVDCVDFLTMPADVESGLRSDLKLVHQCATAVVTGDAGKEANKAHEKLHMATHGGTAKKRAKPASGDSGYGTLLYIQRGPDDILKIFKSVKVADL